MYTHSRIGGYCCYKVLSLFGSLVSSTETNQPSSVAVLSACPPPPASSESGAVGVSRINSNIDNNSSGSSSVCRKQRKPCFRGGKPVSGSSNGGGGAAARGSRVLTWSRRLGLAFCLAWLLCFAVWEFYVRTYCLQVGVLQRANEQRSRLSEQLGCLFLFTWSCGFTDCCHV